MKKARAFFSLITFTIFALLAGPASAASLCPANFGSLCRLDPNTNPDSISGAVTGIVSALIILAIILTLLYLVYGGIKYITSGGDKGKVDQAKSHLTAAIIGLVIALGAFFILNIISYVFTGQGFNSFKVPTLIP